MKSTLPPARTAKKKIEFKVQKGLLPEDNAVHVVYHGREIATIFPDDAQDCAIIVASPMLKDFSKQVVLENGSEAPARVPSVVITLTPRK